MTAQTVTRPYGRLELLKLMFLSRQGDRREGILLRQGKGWFQVSGWGHEALAAAAWLLESDDYLFPYYRDRALVLARGVSNAQLASAYFAKLGSSSAGRQMPAHFSDRKKNIWSVPTPTGANCLPACGVAWAMQLDHRPNVVLATIGDAASRQGEFAEAVSFAVERQLPIVFIVEDNNYGISTNTEKLNPFKLGIFGKDFVVNLDGRHPDFVYDSLQPLFQKARTGGGPSVVVAQLDRLCSHTSSDDQRIYRPLDEIEAMQSRDPLDVYARELIAAGQLTVDQWQQIQSDISLQVDQDYWAAQQEADPEPKNLLDQLVADSDSPCAASLSISGKPRMVDALNEVFRLGLASSDRFVMFGEDIQAPKGGVFGLTAGLSEEFPDRVFNSPLAEATIAGVGIGMACYGMRPIFEFQFIDFVGPALNQILQNLATLRWRSHGQWSCPVVFYAPYGAYLPGGALWHSQANESLFAHAPGIQVVVPSTPEDAAGLMWTAMHSHNPTLFLIPKHLLRQPMQSPEPWSAIEMGSAKIRRSGKDVTLVTWGNCVEIAEAAADLLHDDISVEIVDLRSIQPWDRPTIAKSLQKSGRLVVVQEDGRSCSVGQMIISEILSDPDSFYQLLSPPQLVSKCDIPIGYNPIYEFTALPDQQRVVAALHAVMEY